MKASDYFNSMDEVSDYLESFKGKVTDDEYNLLKRMLGLAEQEGIYDEVDGIGKIDSSISYYIKEFNRVGLTTLASCSGLRKDHPNAKEHLSGYISFLDTDLAKNVINNVADMLNIPHQDSECYLKPSIYVRFENEDAEREKDIQNFFNEVLNFINGKRIN